MRPVKVNTSSPTIDTAFTTSSSHSKTTVPLSARPLRILLPKLKDTPLRHKMLKKFREKQEFNLGVSKVLKDNRELESILNSLKVEEAALSSENRKLKKLVKISDSLEATLFKIHEQNRKIRKHTGDTFPLLTQAMNTLKDQIVSIFK